jgi:hypothetical protein
MLSVLKANRKREPFSEQKVLDSIKRARIPEEIQADALAHVKSKVYDGISTEEIYLHILEFLNKSPQPYSRARYSLKESIMMLGPTGYPFEDFIASILTALGYEARVRQMLDGRCVTHEIDILAQKDGKTAMIEAKFHNSPGSRSDVQVALYTKSRFEDVKDKNNIQQAWIVTNTKTTTDANVYAQCSGLKVISWSYPEGESLREIIETNHLYPLTMLTSLVQNHKMTLLTHHIILCKELYKNPSLLDILPLSREEKEKVMAEVHFICNENAKEHQEMFKENKSSSLTL